MRIDANSLRREFEDWSAREVASLEEFLAFEAKQKAIPGEQLADAYGPKKKKQPPKQPKRDLDEKLRVAERERKALVAAHEEEKEKWLKEMKSLKEKVKRLTLRLEMETNRKNDDLEKEKQEFREWSEKQRQSLKKERKLLAAPKLAPKTDNGELDALRATIATLQLKAEEQKTKARDREQALREVTKQQATKIQQLNTAIQAAEALHLQQPKQKKKPERRRTIIDDRVVAEPPWRIVRDGIKERVWTTGQRQVQYPNGTLKKIDPDQGTTVVEFANGDVKTTENVSGHVIYYYKDADTTHETDPNKGIDVFHFPNGKFLFFKFLPLTNNPITGQIEDHYQDGSKHIKFPDGTTKFVAPDGSSKTEFPDGAVVLGGDTTSSLQ